MDQEEKALLVEFEGLKPALVGWASFVDETIVRIVKAQHSESNFIQMPPTHRCKSDKSFIEKALYREKDYTNPLLEIEDKVATRIVVVTSDNVYKVKAILIDCDEWEYKITKDIYELIDESPNLFDYQSVHLVLWPKEKQNGLDPTLLTCEVQIRTLLQHSYAEVTHDSVYKGPYKNDNVIKRSLAKCMALMETTDDMFCQIFSKISMAEGIKESPSKKYVVELTHLYNGLLHRNIDYRTLDINFTDSIFLLLNKLPVTIEDLSEYCHDNEYTIKRGIETGHSQIFNQPAVLLVFYYSDLFPGFLEEEWMLTSALLRKIQGALNLSTGRY
jgi:ppGpp synthetase/RelA/SpoT-type nucleotidyltranferase